MTETYFPIQGIYRDVLQDAEGRVVFDAGWVSNVIVTSCRKLLASFMMNDPNTAHGIQYLAVGRGRETWDDEPEPPTAEDTQLIEAPPCRVYGLEIAYLDPPPSNRIEIRATLEPECPDGFDTYPLREFGLFGRIGDSESGEDYMINNIRHPVIHKDKSETLIRVVRLTF